MAANKLHSEVSQSLNNYHTSRSKILSPLAPPLHQTPSISFGVQWSSLAKRLDSRLTVVTLLNSFFFKSVHHTYRKML